LPSVVILSYLAPPQPNPGATRIGSFVRYLPEFGWKPILVTSRLAGEGPTGAAETQRVGDPLYWYRSLRHGAGSQDEGVPRELARVGESAAGFSALLGFLAARALPDMYVGWVPGAVLAAVRAARKWDASAILSSSPPVSTHIAALIVAWATGLPWVADFRDGWTFESLRPDQSQFRHAVDARLERLVCNRADGLTAATQGIATDFAIRYGSGHWIPNGFDEERIPAVAVREAWGLLDPEFFNLVYTGTFWVSRYSQSPLALVAAMERVQRAARGRRVRLTIVGSLHPNERAMLDGVDAIRHHPHQPRPVALAVQQIADALVVVAPKGDRAVVPTKFYEYVGSGRPVLTVAEDRSELASLARGARVGPVVPDDADLIASAILDLEERAIKPEEPKQAGRLFHRRVAVGEMAELLTATARAACRGGR
jgi:hypothetical protein